MVAQLREATLGSLNLGCACSRAVLAFGDVLAEEDGSSLGAVVEGALPLHEPHQHKVTGLPHIEPVRPAQTPAEGATDGHRAAAEQDKPKGV